ncbi:MAG: TetR/AcrR family transcriptional regulator [Hyphomonadaceae bacterium]|nr:TetR/AcrR family transcriptional regulator [Hyphomonadaceae bacterium]
MARRSKEDAQATRDSLLEAARKLFQQYGFKETTVSQIVAEAGITKGALFHYFKTKDALFREIWVTLQMEMDEEARKAAADASDPCDPYAAFLAGCETYLRWAMRPDYQRIVLVDGLSVLGLTGWYEADNHLGRNNVRSGISYLAKCGVIPEARIPALTVLVHNALNGAGLALARGEPGLSADDIIKAFEMILRSLRDAPPGRS